MKDNYMLLKFPSYSKNESFARNVASCFALSLNPSLADISDIKTAVSEAVTNCIVHAYPDQKGEITIEGFIEENVLHINIFDNGVGIENIDSAMQPFFTSKPENERSGMGFTIMKSFMDEVKVSTSKGNGTKVYMSKIIKTDEN